MQKALKLSFLYSALSTIIGPLLVLISSRHPSGWDCTDPSWDFNISLTAREAIYDHNAQFMVVGAYIMLVIGISLLSYLVYVAIVNKRIIAALAPALLMIFMFIGYGAIIVVTAAPWCGPGF